MRFMKSQLAIRYCQYHIDIGHPYDLKNLSWSYYMDGFSIFYSPRGEEVLDQMTSVTVIGLAHKQRTLTRLTLSHI